MRWLPEVVDHRQRRVLFLAACALFLAEWADVSVKNVSETLFLKRIGVEYLPLAFLANGFVLLATTSFLGTFAARVDPYRLFTWALAGLGTVLLLLFGLIQIGRDASFPLLLLASKQIGSISLLGFASAVGAIVAPRQQKAVLPRLLAVGTLGSILGSFASGPLGRWLDVQALLPVSAVLLFLGAAATLSLWRLPATRIVRARPRSELESSRARSLRSTRQLWRESWLFRALVISAFLCGAVGPMLYFQFAYVADAATHGRGGEEKLLALFGQVRGSLLLGVLLAQLWLAPALYRRVGVPLAGTFSPLLYLLGFGGLTFRLGLPEGVVALSGATVQDQAVHDPSQRLLCGLFPEEIRPRILVLMEGTAKRAGGCIGNLLVIAAVLFGNAWWVGVIGLPVTLAWYGVTLRIWRGYPSLVLALATEPRRLSHAGTPIHELIDPRTLRSFAVQLARGGVEDCRTVIELMREMRPDAAPALLADALPHARAGSRATLVSGLEAAVEDLQATSREHRERAHALEAWLRDPGFGTPRERAALVRVYARLQSAAAVEPAARSLLQAATHDSSAAVRIAAEVALYRLGLRRGSPLSLRRVLAPALESPDPDVQRVAIVELRALLIADPGSDATDVEPGGSEWKARLSLLIGALGRPRGRAEAARCLADVARRHGPVVAEAAAPMRACVDDPDPSVRAAVLRFAGHARQLDLAPLLVERLAARSPEEAAAASDALRALGTRALDAMLPELRVGRRQVRDAIVPLLRSLDTAPEPFEAQLWREVDAVATRLLEIGALRGHVRQILLQRLEERVQEGLHSVFLLLAALHDDDRIVELADSLSQVQTPRERALRVEALEALLSPEQRKRILPLVEDPTLDHRVDAAARLLERPPPSPDAALSALRVDRDALTRALLPVALASPQDGKAPPGQGAVAPIEAEAELVAQLRCVDLFEHLTVRQLWAVARLARREEFPAGATVVREGGPARSLYTIVRGHVVVRRFGVDLGQLKAGEFFGEFALFDDEPRIASVTALDPVTVLRINGSDLVALMQDLPGVAIAISRKLAQLVRKASEQALASAGRSRGEPGNLRDAP